MKFLRFILSHSIFIACSAVALSLQTLLLLHLPVNFYLLLFIFFASLCGYNSYWLLGKFSLHTGMSFFDFLKKQYSYLSMIVVGCLGMLFSLLFLKLFLYNIIITFFLLGLYSIPLLPFKQLYFTRKAGFAKTIVLSITWAHVTTMIPLQKSFLHLQVNELLIYMIHFLFVLMLCIIFDKRDAAMDSRRGMHSMATDLNEKMLHSTMLIIFVLFSLICIALQKYNIELRQSVGLLATAVITLIVYHYSRKEQNYFFYYFLVDGLMLFSGLLTYLLSI